MENNACTLSHMPQRKRASSFGKSGWIYLGLVLLLSFFTYFYNYTSPQSLFWDEHHHVPNAQKYLSRVYHLEGHPPLGKMFIALGEKMIDANSEENDKLFTSVTVSKDVPDGFEVTGYRFFPALLGWLTAPILFFIFFLILRNSLFATLLSFLFIFDNAMPAHFRSAMLDGTLLFFIALTILSFLLILEWKKEQWKFALASLLFGASLAAACTTKLTGLFLLLLIPALLIPLWPKWKQYVRFLVIALFSFLIVFLGVWQLHFSIGTNVEPNLPYNGYFNTFDEHKILLDEGRVPPVTMLPVLVLNAHKFMLNYNFNVKGLDLCDPDEKGSPAYLWPLGARSIPLMLRRGEDKAWYLYLQANPVVWWSSSLAVLISIVLLTLSFGLGVPLKKRFLISTFFIMYFCYMIVISSVDRVMYLYHYFPPLLISFILLVLAFNEIKKIGNYTITDEKKKILCIIFAALIFVSFQFYRPLTYFQPLTKAQIEHRAIFPLWNLKCRGCERTDTLLVPQDCEKEAK